MSYSVNYLANGYQILDSNGNVFIYQTTQPGPSGSQPFASPAAMQAAAQAQLALLAPQPTTTTPA